MSEAAETLYSSDAEAREGLTVDKLDGLLSQLDDQTEWTQKVDARQTGYSLHIRWADEQKRDVTAAIEHQHVLTDAPAMLYDALSRLRAIVAEAVDQ